MPNGDASTVGQWLGPVKTPGYSEHPPGGDDSRDGVFAVHAVLMHTGNVLFFSGYFESQGYAYRSWEFDPIKVANAFETDDDPEAEAQDSAVGRWFLPGFEGEDQGPDIDDDPDIDLFCAHHVQLGDGRILVVGGDSQQRSDSHDNRGLHIYDPQASRWTDLPHRMAAGRWYPTAVTLPDGRVAIFSGDSNPRAARNDWPGNPADLSFFDGNFVEVELVGPHHFDPDMVVGGVRDLYTYPGLVLVKGGHIYNVPTMWDHETDLSALETQRFTLTGETSGSWSRLDPEGRHPASRYRQEGTFVLLPPAREGKILVIGGYDGSTDDGTVHSSCEILETQHRDMGEMGARQERWVDAGQMHHKRTNVNAVLLPTGKVLIVGGHSADPHDHEGGGHGESGAIQKTPEIYDPSVDYNPDNPQAAFTEVAEMNLPRLYHSTTLLLPDGHVLTAGGYNEPGHGGGAGDQHEMEFYKPPYMFIEGDRPEILDVSGHGPNAIDVRYGEDLIIDFETPAGDPIEQVVLMRPGSTTHHTDTEQRYEDLSFIREDVRIRADVPGDPSILPPGYYMLWLIDARGRPCKEARFVRVSQRTCTLVTDRSHISQPAYDAEATHEGDTVEFQDSLYVILHGFVPEELGIHTADPDQDQLRDYAPRVSVLEDGAPTLGVVVVPDYPNGMHLEDPDGAVDVRQRVTFEYSVLVGDRSEFPTTDGDGAATRRLDLEANVQGFTCKGELTLVSSPNPYILDGQPHWLSKDLRVFQVQDGESVAGVELTASQSPTDYLDEFLQACRAAGEGPGNPFNVLPRDSEASKLELAPRISGNRVLNFAVARVRLQAPSEITADNVHMFFRLFVTTQPTLPYHPRAFPRSEGSPAYAQVGQTPGEIVTIPFYATDRDAVDSSPFDEPNIQNLHGAGDDDPEGEAVYYFGAWLDLNQPSEHPLTDPSTGQPRSVQDLLRGRHQCMVGEIFFQEDETPIDATPANNDNLTQRNLAIVNSDNPGGPDAHTILHTLNLTPTWSKQRIQTREGNLEPADMLVGPRFFKQEPVEARPDELAIFWGDVPRDAQATLYFPALDADEIVELSRLEGRAGVIERRGPHTIQCPVADITYVPLPSPTDDDLAGLITIQMPNHVEAGQRYRVVARHYSRMKGRIEGTVELLVPVNEPPTFQDESKRELAILRHIAQTLPADSRWSPVFERYLEGLAARVAGLGGEPATIAPSPTGTESDGRDESSSEVRDLIECILDSGSLDEYLRERDVDPSDLKACLTAGEQDGHRGRKRAGRQHPLGILAHTGQKCPESGVWKVSEGRETAPIAEGDRMPPYNDAGVTWKLVQYA